MEEVEFEKISLEDVRAFLGRKIRSYEHKMTQASSRVTYAKYRSELSLMRSILLYLNLRHNAQGKV
jgi:hypothetical protein